MRFLLLVVPGLLALIVPLYNMVSPELFGVPFFYWFQLLMVVVSAIGIYFADRLRKA